MKSVFGTTRNANGDFVAVKLVKRGELWESSAVKTWPVRGYGAELHSIGKAVYLAVKGAWQPTSYTDEQADRIVVPGAGGFSASVFRAERDIDMEVFGCSVSGTVPTDSYLTTIPLHYAESVTESFVSVYVEDEIVHVGVTIDRTPAVVFHLGSGTDERMLEGHLGRVERYWNRLDTGVEFPQTVYNIGNACSIPSGWIRVSPGNGCDDKYSLTALGAALCHVYRSVPFFSGSEHSPRVSALRGALTYAAAAVFVLGIAGVGIPLGIHKYNRIRIDSFEKEYRRVVSGNAEIRAGIRETDSLARTVLRLHKEFSRRTTWGRFLEELGRIRPDGLYLSRLGSEPIENNNSEVRIAVVGWAHKEELITTLMGSLQSTGMVDDIQLASLERDKKNRAITRFRILCRLTLTENI